MIQKHIGVISNLGTTVVIVMPYLPDEPSNCLVVEVEALPPIYSDTFSRLVKDEGQTSNEPLANLLSRRMFASGENMLKALHDHGHLRKIAVDQITLNVNLPGDTPRKMPLQDLVAALVANDPNAKAVDLDAEPVHDAPAVVTQQLGDLSNEDQASNYLTQAMLLDADAKHLKEKAYALDPSLKPVRKPRKPAVKKTAVKKPRAKADK